MMMSHGGARKSFSSSINKNDLAAIGYDIDPNDDVPNLASGKSDPWNPAALVSAAKSKLSDGRIDKHGFYTNVKGINSTATSIFTTSVDRRKKSRTPNCRNRIALFGAMRVSQIMMSYP